MINIKINDIPIQVPEGSTILEAARLAHIHIPHLCFLKDINEVAACRLCCVEIEGSNKLIPACDNVVVEGMVIRTDTERVRKSVRYNLALILSQHKAECTYCVRSGNCQLQNLANEYNIDSAHFEKQEYYSRANDWNKKFPLIRDNEKCVHCLRCVNICDKVQGMNIWDLVLTGKDAHIAVKNNKKIERTDCTLCGQCITHCPVGALTERSDVPKVSSILDDKDIITIFQFAPAIRNTWLEPFDIDKSGIDTEKRLVGVLKTMGADYVFDTSFAADLTIMEESNELIKRLTSGDLGEYPMFTSCCPGWVRFVKKQYPELVKNLSTAKSPHEMGGAIVKSYFAEKMGLDKSKIKVVSIMPCVAKKAEAELPTLMNEGLKNVDYVLTTRELARLINHRRIHINRVEDRDFDRLIGDYTGAGVIFGTTGGVMEAALRTAYHTLTGNNPPLDLFTNVRQSGSGLKTEATAKIGDVELKLCVVSSLGETRKVCEDIVKGRVKYDFVEVMACPTGCSGGGGQPIHCDDIERGRKRGDILYAMDEKMPIRFSHENPDVITLYNDYLGTALSEKAEELLHTNHEGWQMP